MIKTEVGVICPGNEAVRTEVGVICPGNEAARTEVGVVCPGNEAAMGPVCMSVCICTHVEYNDIQCQISVDTDT